MSALKQISKQFEKYLKLAKELYQDKRTPKLAKILLWMAIAYAMLPFDLIPDFIPVVGYLDDVLVIPGLILVALLLLPKELYNYHYIRVFN
jgi:uncharacterized membrane protein YkvA (DUF1232 family)